ncbi:hypothetical protein ACTFIU_006672 [Dictyostelium citrinum]
MIHNNYNNYNNQNQNNNIKINNKNEILFWKVYRNIYLNKIIFEQLESEIIFKDYRMSNSKSRVKFKDIRSLKWMIDNCEFQILKRKIENKEFIQICRGGIESLVKIKDYNLSLELFEMLMKNQRDNVENCKPIDFAIQHENLKMLKVFISEPYSLEITLSHIESAVRRSSPQFLDELLSLSNQNLIIGSIHHIYWVFNRGDYKRHELLNVIVQHPEMLLPITQTYSLYQVILKISTITSIEQLFSLIEVNFFKRRNLDIKQLINEIVNQDFKYSINISKILIFFGFYIQCLENNQQTITKIKEIKSKMLDIFNKNNNNNNYEKEKQLFKLFILEIDQNNSKEIYKIYFYNYYELIDELNNNSYKSTTFLNILSNFDKIIKLKDKYQITNFIIEIINQVNLKSQKHHLLLNKIIDTIINHLMDDECNYKIIIKEIKRKGLQKFFSLPLEWNSILKEIMIEPIDGGLNQLFINDKETIDWLSSTFKLKVINFKNVKTIYNNKMKKGLVQFSTYQLYRYSILILNKYSFGKRLMRSIIYPSIYAHPLISKTKATIITNNHLDKSEIIELLFKSIILNNINETILYLNLIDLNNDCKQFISIWNKKSKSNEYRFSFLDPLFSKTDIGTIKNVLVDIVINSIKFWIKKAEENFQNNNCSNDLESLFEIIINYLFKKLIQNQNVSINQVIEIRELIFNLNRIKLEHTEFHVFYYLNIRSPKLIRFLLLNQSFLSLLGSVSTRFPDGLRYYCLHHIVSNIVSNAFSPIRFSFDLLFGNNREPFINLLDYFNGFWFTSNKVDILLQYYLDINRFDLFLKEFEANKVVKEGKDIRLITIEFIKALSVVGNIDGSKLKIFQKYIVLIQRLNFNDEILNYSILTNRKELVSFVISYLKLTSLKIYNSSFNLCYYDLFKYIFENHSNHITSVTILFNLGECISSSDTFIQDSISLFDLFLKYYPQSLDRISYNLDFYRIKRTKHNTKIFDYFLSNKLLNKESLK